MMNLRDRIRVLAFNFVKCYVENGRDYIDLAEEKPVKWYTRQKREDNSQSPIINSYLT